MPKPCTSFREDVLVASLAEPSIDLGPDSLIRATADHHTNVATAHMQEQLIFRADLIHHGGRLTGRHNVIFIGDHIQEITAEISQIHQLAAQFQRALDQAILP
ncbi:MAG: hypothetical protein HGA19_12745, partial [Oscillochloris sp.]|nr:hypothetical protein [Oscillochloris sp.]